MSHLVWVVVSVCCVVVVSGTSQNVLFKSDGALDDNSKAEISDVPIPTDGKLSELLPNLEEITKSLDTDNSELQNSQSGGNIRPKRQSRRPFGRGFGGFRPGRRFRSGSGFGRQNRFGRGPGGRNNGFVFGRGSGNGGPRFRGRNNRFGRQNGDGGSRFGGRNRGFGGRSFGGFGSGGSDSGGGGSGGLTGLLGSNGLTGVLGSEGLTGLLGSDGLTGIVGSGGLAGVLGGSSNSNSGDDDYNEEDER